MFKTKLVLSSLLLSGIITAYGAIHIHRDMDNDNDVDNNGGQQVEVTVGNQSGSQNSSSTEVNIKNINVSRNNPYFNVNLPSNPSTGYQWYLTRYNPNLVKPVGHSVLKTSNNMPGAPSITQWNFKARHDAFSVPQYGKLRFEYRRSFENTPARVQIVTVYFKP
jgi:inhibitor of cysteine peptidase